MSMRTDLALEAAQQISLHTAIEGVSQLRRSYPEISAEVTEITVETPNASRLLGKPMGRYITFESTDGDFSRCSCFEERAECLAEELRKLCKIPEKVLVAGLGNRAITPDSLGPACASKIFATRHIKRLAKDVDTSELREVSVISSGVMAQTGIETSSAIKAICDSISPSLVIAIDALACSELSHLGSTVQMCNTGISPGSGVENARKELSEETLGVPCIAIGIPTVTDGATIASRFGGEPSDQCKGMIVTPRSIDSLIARSSALVSASVNKALHPSLTLEEIDFLIM